MKGSNSVGGGGVNKGNIELGKVNKEMKRPEDKVSDRDRRKLDESLKKDSKDEKILDQSSKIYREQVSDMGERGKPQHGESREGTGGEMPDRPAMPEVPVNSKDIRASDKEMPEVLVMPENPKDVKDLKEMPEVAVEKKDMEGDRPTEDKEKKELEPEVQYQNIGDAILKGILGSTGDNKLSNVELPPVGSVERTEAVNEAMAMIDRLYVSSAEGGDRMCQVKLGKDSMLAGTDIRVFEKNGEINFQFFVHNDKSAEFLNAGQNLGDLQTSLQNQLRTTNINVEVHDERSRQDGEGGGQGGGGGQDSGEGGQGQGGREQDSSGERRGQGR